MLAGGAVRLKCFSYQHLFQSKRITLLSYSLLCTGGVEANENNAKLAFLSSSSMGLLLCLHKIQG